MHDSDVVLTGSRILLVDDQPANLDVLCELLETEGYEISLAPNGEVALKIATHADTVPDLILLDVMMPGMDGYEVCRRLRADEATRDIPVVFVTARDVTEGVLAGFAAGGVDYVTKPFRDEEVLVRVRTHLRLNRLARALAQRNAELSATNDQLRAEVEQRQRLKGQLSKISELEAQRWGLPGFVGESPTIQEIFRTVRLLQEGPAMSVLISGENGTGKELIARAIHFGSDRREGPFIPINCAALPAELAESLLFGHVRGAFTGAGADRCGHFEAADGGALFLDEVGDMPSALQAKLLRVLEDGEVWRVGASQGKAVNVRVLGATNADLQQRIEAGTFRQDLYFRLARFTVVAPPLRERREDIPILAQHFLSQLALEMGREAPEPTAAAQAALQSYDYPGNVRELRNIVERALIESRGGDVGVEHLHFQMSAGLTGASVPTGSRDAVPVNLEEAERWLMRRAIDLAEGNISEAARLMGTNRMRIYRTLGAENLPAEGG